MRNVFSYFPPLTVKTNRADTGVRALSLSRGALVYSRGEILCSGAFKLGTPHYILSSQPNFHHQKLYLIRLTRKWGLLLYACACECVWASVWRALPLSLCLLYSHRGQTQGGRGTLNLWKQDHFLGAPPSDWRSPQLQLSGSIRRHRCW